MNDDDLTIGQKLRTTYFKALLLSFSFLMALAIYYVATVKTAFPPLEDVLVLSWFFFFFLVLWLLLDFLDFTNLRHWIGWLGTRRR